MKAPITRDELKRRLLECGGISPDDAENAAVMKLMDRIEALEKVKEQAQEIVSWADGKEAYQGEVEIDALLIANLDEALSDLDDADAEEK